MTSLQDIYDIRGPVMVAQPMPWWAWLLIILGAGLLCGSAIWIWTKKYYASRKTPYEEALEALKEAHSKIHEVSDKIYCSILSDALRYYLENVLHLPVVECTTEEFLSQARSEEFLDIALLPILEPFLAQCDEVKFAKQEVTLQQREDLLAKATAVIERVHQYNNQSEKTEA